MYKDTTNGEPNSLCYARTNIRIGGVRHTLSLHRLICETDRHLKVDHINHNTLDNRRENLRAISHSGNIQNISGARSDSLTGVRGVTFKPKNDKYEVRVGINGKRIHVGYFKTLEEAETAAIKARAKYLPFSKEAREAQTKN